MINDTSKNIPRIVGFVCLGVIICLYIYTMQQFYPDTSTLMPSLFEFELTKTGFTIASAIAAFFVVTNMALALQTRNIPSQVRSIFAMNVLSATGIYTALIISGILQRQYGTAAGIVGLVAPILISTAVSVPVVIAAAKQLQAKANDPTPKPPEPIL